jgi:hypothetical protein
VIKPESYQNKKSGNPLHGSKKIIKHKVGLFKSCRIMGLSRGIFIVIKTVVDEGAIESL